MVLLVVLIQAVEPLLTFVLVSYMVSMVFEEHGNFLYFLYPRFLCFHLEQKMLIFLVLDFFPFLHNHKEEV